MRASEILRQMADMIDAKSQPEQSHDHDSDLIPVPDDVFLPPLQGKYELLKKAVGVDNAFDSNADAMSDDPEASNHKVTHMDIRAVGRRSIQGSKDCSPGWISRTHFPSCL
jgi:hypothetical protein